MTAKQQFIVRDLRLAAEEAGHADKHLRGQIAERLQINASEIESLTVLKRALDARKRHAPTFVYSVVVAVRAADAHHALENAGAVAYEPPRYPRYFFRGEPPAQRPVVVGAGPAGLFAALTLADAGWPAIVVERGQSVDERPRSVSQLYAHGKLNRESNVCYGEGGAGTFSDGKLYTRLGDPRIERFLERLVSLGAPQRIQVDTRPHLGTDRLIGLLRNLRQHLLDLGVEFQFDTKATAFTIKDEGKGEGKGSGTIAGVQTAQGHIDCAAVVLATGHSARDVWLALEATGRIAMEARPFSVGFRVEHPQALIDNIRYGKAHQQLSLPAADYRLRFNDPLSNRGVYSFCMCPGGVVVPTPTEDDALVTNGMSHASRSGRYANSALVVTIDPKDYAGEDLFAGVRFQHDIEERAYALGGGAFVAPAMRVTDFLTDRKPKDVPSSSYRRGLNPVALAGLYPAFVDEALKAGLQTFNQRMRGFVSEEAVLIAPETRSASPIRVLRDDSRQAVGVTGLYPVGEGMGYGGGIVSAAIDGVRSAEALLLKVGAQTEEASVALPHPDAIER